MGERIGFCRALRGDRQRRDKRQPWPQEDES